MTIIRDYDVTVQGITAFIQVYGDKSKTSYAALPTIDEIMNITGEDVESINLLSCFRDCTSLTTAPAIPNSGVTGMDSCFYGCTSLTTAPEIPSGVTNMYACFYGCTSLTTAPAIPNSVTNMAVCFSRCTSLTGKIVINANPSTYARCMGNTQEDIVLVGSSTLLQNIANTANNGNVYVWSLSINLSAERQEDDSSKANVSVIINRFRNNNESVSLTFTTNGVESTPVQVTMDTATKTYTGVLSIASFSIVELSVIAEDSYGKSAPKSITIPIPFYTIDFQAGGKEIAVGAPANDDTSNRPYGLFKCGMDAQFGRNAEFYGNLALGTALSIENGGTGATSLAAAQENLGIKANSERIDNLILGTGTSPVEVQDARLSSDGTQYTTLKSRLDAENSELKGDLVDLEDVMYGKLLDKPQDIAPTILSGTPVVRDNSNTVVSVDGNTISATFNFDGDKWIAFPLPDDADKKDYDFYVTVDDASKITKIETTYFTTGSTSGFSDKVFDVVGNNYSATTQLKTTDNPKFISIVLTRDAVSLVANVVIKERGGVQVKHGLIPDFKQGKTSLYIGGQSGINSEESTTSDDGRYNTSLGIKSMLQNTTGNHNTSVGFQALELNTTGCNNTALGEDALFENITGDTNTALGIRALQQNVSGSRNVSVGGSSMYNCTSGGMNVVIGTNAGGGITTESNNILIGHNENISAGVENSIGIGYWDTVEQSNTVQIGSSSQSLILCGKRITFNADGTVTWESV